MLISIIVLVNRSPCMNAPILQIEHNFTFLPPVLQMEVFKRKTNAITINVKL